MYLCEGFIAGEDEFVNGHRGLQLLPQTHEFLTRWPIFLLLLLLQTMKYSEHNPGVS